MALTKTSFSMIAGAPINVDDYIPVGTDTATTDCSAYIQAAIDAASTTNGKSVVFSSKSYRINSTIEIKTYGFTVDGRGCELDYYGTSVAFDFVPISGVTYPTSCCISNVTVRVRTATSGTGFRIRASYSLFENLGVVLYAAATNARGIMLVGDEANGTGPYYNTFYNCSVQSQSNGLSHIGVSFVASAPIYRAPNTNTWIGGRSAGCLTNYVIKGAGNNFYNPTSENYPGRGTAFKFEADTPANCVQNNIFGAYIENAATGVEFTADSISNSYHNGYVTGATTYITDSGTNNLLIDTTVASKLPTGVNPNGTASSDPEVLDAYEEGTWTAVIQGGVTAGTYEIATNYCNYTRVGRQVTIEGYIVLAGSITGGGSGYLKITGLPFAKRGNSYPEGALALGTVNLPASVSTVTIGFESIGSNSALLFNETNDNSGITNTAIGSLAASSQISFSLTYFV